jgi:hypothetical protein
MIKRRDYALQLGDQECWKMKSEALCAYTANEEEVARYTYLDALAMSRRILKADPDIAAPLLVVEHPAGPEPEGEQNE